MVRADKIIKVTNSIKNKLNKAKVHKRETYNDVISRLLEGEIDDGES